MSECLSPPKACLAQALYKVWPMGRSKGVDSGLWKPRPITPHSHTTGLEGPRARSIRQGLAYRLAPFHLKDGIKINGWAEVTQPGGAERAKNLPRPPGRWRVGGPFRPLPGARPPGQGLGQGTVLNCGAQLPLEVRTGPGWVWALAASCRDP